MQRAGIMIRFFFLVSFFLREAAASKESEREREHLLDRVLRKRQKKVENAYTKDRTSASCDTGLFGGLRGISAETRGTGRRGGEGEEEEEKGEERGGGGRTTTAPASTSLPLSPLSSFPRATERRPQALFTPKEIQDPPLNHSGMHACSKQKKE